MLKRIEFEPANVSDPCASKAWEGPRVCGSSRAMMGAAAVR